MLKTRRIRIYELSDDIVEKILKHWCERYNSKVLREISLPLREYGRCGPLIEYREFEIGEFYE